MQKLLDVLIRTADGKETMLYATPNHPFYVPSRQEYVELGELILGTLLQTADQQQATIIAMNIREGKFDVYNIEVEGPHNYFVSEQKVLVHNKPVWNQIYSTAKSIAGGHAFKKHKSEFKKLGITTESQFADFIDDIMRNAEPQNVRSLSRGRTAYWDDATGTVVIHDPGHADLGTVFRPTNGKKDFRRLK